MSAHPFLSAACALVLAGLPAQAWARAGSETQAKGAVALDDAPPRASDQPLRASRSHARPRGRPRASSLPPRRVAMANRQAAEPQSQAFVNAAQVYAFEDDAIYRVYAAPGQVTDMVLEPGETLGSVASGDTARWIIGDANSGTGETRRTHILIKPVAAGLSTNLVVTTDRRTYHLAATSTAHVATTLLSWTYAKDALLALREPSDAPTAPVASGLAAESLNFNYAIRGAKPSWRPIHVFDDGRQTFIGFPPSLLTGEAPPLFLIDAQGGAQLVNYRVSGTWYVVDRLFDQAELRLGAKRQERVRIKRQGARPSQGRGA